jgi:hypothetical protein
MNFSTRSAAALAAVTAMFVAVPVAFADVSSDDSGLVGTQMAIGCGYGGTSVFAPWGDRHDYALLSGGDFENGADGWALDGGAAVADGNEPFQVGGPADHQSLALPAGSSATSPTFCVSRREDTVRFFVRTDSGRKARLKVEALYTDVTRGKDSDRIVKLHADATWDATDRLSVDLPQARGRLDTANVALRFTPLDDNGFQVDDVYIDPRLRN